MYSANNPDHSAYDRRGEKKSLFGTAKPTVPFRLPVPSIITSVWSSSLAVPNRHRRYCAYLWHRSLITGLAIYQAPEDLLEDYKIISAIDAICGTYKTAYNLYSLTISQQGGILKLDGEIDDGPISFPLLARDIEKLDFAPYSLRSDNKAKIQFMRDDQGRVAYVSYDR